MLPYFFIAAQGGVHEHAKMVVSASSIGAYAFPVSPVTIVKMAVSAGNLLLSKCHVVCIPSFPFIHPWTLLLPKDKELYF